MFDRSIDPRNNLNFDLQDLQRVHESDHWDDTAPVIEHEPDRASNGRARSVESLGHRFTGRERNDTWRNNFNVYFLQVVFIRLGNSMCYQLLLNISA